jgi:HSP20 family protein
MFMRTAVIAQAHPVRQPLDGTWSRPAPIPMDVWREDDRIVIALDLPGIPAEAVEVEATGRQVTVRAERRPAPRGEGARTQLSERAHGVFARRIQLADTLDADALQARLENGVLTLTVPVTAAAQPRKIAVQSPDELRRSAGGGPVTAPAAPAAPAAA